jgi:hypothetical protein
MSINSSNMNRNFKKVEDLAGYLSNVSVGELDVSGVATVGRVLRTEKGTSTTVTGWTPRTWPSKAANSNVSLLRTENGVEASSRSLTSLLTIPSNAIIQKVVVTNVGSAGLIAGSFSIGLAPLNSSNEPNRPIVTTLMDDTDWSLLGVGATNAVQVGGSKASAAAALGAAGIAHTDILQAGVVVASPNNFVTVNSSVVPTGTKLRVDITYLNN